MFALEVSKRVQREIWRLSDQDRKRLVKEIDKLVADPFTRRKRIKKLKGMKDGWRLRAGGIRALYTLDKRNKWIKIYRVGKRGDVY